jgi:ABC-type uncharacterized transport system permease subunit
MDWLASNWGLLVLAVCTAVLIGVFMRRTDKGPRDPSDSPPRN